MGVISRNLTNTLLASFAITLFTLSAFGSGPAPTGALTLAWDPSADPSVMGYRLYQGTSSQIYSSVVDIGDQTTATMSALVGGVTYYFAVTAYDADGLESAFSGELSYTVPTTAPRPPTSLAVAQITPDGSNHMSLIGTGPAGWVYQVYATQDFLSWLLLGSVTVDGTGAFQFTDPATLLPPRRFYRLLLSSTKPGTSAAAQRTMASPVRSL